MDQHPKVTLDWALCSLERAIQHLENGWAERRVRRQFHQLLLAVEREAFRHGDATAPAAGLNAEPIGQR
jgi:hypothetical protein